MYENKILINLYVLSLGNQYELFIPVNEKVGNIVKLLSTTLFDSINIDTNNKIFNMESGELYSNNTIIRDTSIINGSRLVLV